MLGVVAAATQRRPRLVKLGVWVRLALTAGSWVAPTVAAQPVEIPATFGGDLRSRPRLTGDCLGCVTRWASSW